MARAIAANDAQALMALFATPVTFRAVTPGRFWDAETPLDVADIFLHSWFGPDRAVSDVASIETDTLSDVEKVSYQLEVDLDSGPSVIEQVAYYSVTEGQITDLRLVCSGFRPK